MASIRQRGKKKTWYALFRDAAGKLVERSCKTGDKKTAQGLADEWEKMARPSANETTVENMRRVIADLHVRFLGKEMPTMTLRGYCDYWLKVRKNEISNDTYGFYERAIFLFCEFMGARADDDLFRVTKADIVTFRDAERARVSAKTTNHELKVLRMIFRQARSDGWSPENPCEGVKITREMRSEKSFKRPYTIEELRAVLDVCSDEWKGMVIRGYYTGQRLLDIAMMKAGQEDPHLGQVTFWTGKTDARVIVEMHPAYVNYVLSQPTSDDPDRPLHPAAYTSVTKRSKNRTATISNAFGRLLSKARLRPPRKHRKNPDGPGRTGRRTTEALTFHSLRHSLVSHLQDAGVSRSIVQDIVGHESEEINAAYTHMDRKTKQAAMAKLPDITVKNNSPKG